MISHAIKIARARRLAPALPAAQAEIWRSISPLLVERLTAAELAEVARCLHAHWQRAVAHAQAEVVDEGAVYDHQRGILREVCPHSWDARLCGAPAREVA